MEDADIIIGRNTVREAILSGREIETLYLLSTAEGSILEIASLARKKGIPVRSVPKSKLDELAKPFFKENGARHQGIAARVAAIIYSGMEDIFALAASRDEQPFIIALDGVEDPHNLGAIVRSAEVFGAHGVVLPKRRSAGMTAAAAKAASGAEEYVPIVRVSNLASAIEEVKKKGVFVAAADMDGVSVEKTNLKGAMMFIIGAEGSGVSRLVRERADFVVRIDVRGKISSLNASNAAAVLMYEKRRQDASTKE